MNLATVLIVLILAALLTLAVRHLKKHGMCAACEDRGSCKAAQEKSGTGAASGCSGHCASCTYCSSVTEKQNK